MQATGDPQFALLERSGLLEEYEQGGALAQVPEEQVAQMLQKGDEMARTMKESTSAYDAVNKYILPGVANDEWRILVGEDAIEIDKAVRASPLQAYDAGFAAFGIGEGSWMARQRRSKI